MKTLEQIKQTLKQGEEEKIKQQVNTALQQGNSPKTILNDALLAGMSEIGELFSQDEIFVPEVMIAAQAMNSAMEILKPRLIEDGVPSRGRVVLGTIAGDLHDIGKNLVKIMMEGNGFEVIDLGTDVDSEEFVAELEEKEARILAMSALLTTTMVNMKSVITALKEANLREEVFVMVGGAPVTAEFAEDIGADAYAGDAATAARLAREWIEQ